jgi:hypothetical protein
VTEDDKQKEIDRLKAENIRLSMLVKVLKETLSRTIDTSIELESMLLAERYVNADTRGNVANSTSTHRN